MADVPDPTVGGKDKLFLFDDTVVAAEMSHLAVRISGVYRDGSVHEGGGVLMTGFAVGDEVVFPRRFQGTWRIESIEIENRQISLVPVGRGDQEPMTHSFDWSEGMVKAAS